MNAIAPLTSLDNRFVIERFMWKITEIHIYKGGFRNTFRPIIIIVFRLKTVGICVRKG